MALEQLIAEVRPDGGIFTFDNPPVDKTKPVLIYGFRDEAVKNFSTTMANMLAYGSAILFYDLTQAGLDYVEAIATAHDFRFWHPSSRPERSYLWVKSKGTDSINGTHLPYLLEAVKRTSGPILEMGSGDSSTNQLHEICDGRLLVTLDNQAEWMSKFSHLESSWHKFELHVDPSLSPWLDEKWSVAFVDHAPGETRKNALHRLRKNAEYIVVHDTEELGYGIESVLASFKYREDFRMTRPWTTVVSETKAVW